MIALGQYLAATWPNSTEADEAWMILSDLFLRARDLDQATKMLDHVAVDSPQRAEADLKQGQAYWLRYLTASRLAAEERPPQAELDQNSSQAQQLLERGLARTREKLAQGAEPNLAFLSAELSLAQLYNGSSQYDKAVELLEQATHGPLAASWPPIIRSPNRPILAAETSKAADSGRTWARNASTRPRKSCRPLDAQCIKDVQDGAAALTQFYLGLGLETLKEQVAPAIAGKNGRARASAAGIRALSRSHRRTRTRQHGQFAELGRGKRNFDWPRAWRPTRPKPRKRGSRSRPITPRPRPRMANCSS